MATIPSLNTIDSPASKTPLNENFDNIKTAVNDTETKTTNHIANTDIHVMAEKQAELDSKSRTATYVIAASNTPNKESADFICEDENGKRFNDIIDTIMADMTANPEKQGSMIFVRNGTHYFGESDTVNITKPCHMVFESEFDADETTFIAPINVTANDVKIDNCNSSQGLVSSGQRTKLFNCVIPGLVITGNQSQVLFCRLTATTINATMCTVSNCVINGLIRAITIGANCTLCVFSNNTQTAVSNPKDIYNNQSSNVNFIECALTDELGNNIVDTYQTKILIDYTTITTPTEGRQAWNPTTHKPVYYNGTAWIYADGTLV